MKYIFTLIAVLTLNSGFGQNMDDILRYSFHNSFSTARSAGMGGAFGALGADLSSLSSNPAGLGLYRRGDFSFTPNIGGSSANSNFDGSNSSDSDIHLKVNSIGFVTTQESTKTTIKKISFGIAYNRLANFNGDFTITGNNSNSLLDLFAGEAQGIDYLNIYDQGSSGSILSWDAFLIDTISGTVDQYSTAIPSGGSFHEVMVERNGGMGEMLIGGGANLNDRLFWGLTIGLPVVRFREEITHTEAPKNASLPLSSFTYTQNLEVSGGGINAKVGVLLKATEKLRVGAVYHTRTVLSLNDTYSSGISADFQSNVNTPQDFAGSFDYRIVIPSKLMANMAFIAGKNALVSADYEFTNYSTGKLRRSTLAVDPYDFAQENEEAKEAHTETHNVRIGAEFRVAQVYRLRLGARYMQNPFSNGAVEPKASSNILMYTIGAGIRKNSFYADVAGIYSKRDTQHFMYDSSLVNAAQIETHRFNLMFTIGLRI
ncbi:MAG: OmpP1/FadL family transporter [Flavobacteriales bacterium]